MAASASRALPRSADLEEAEAAVQLYSTASDEFDAISKPGRRFLDTLAAYFLPWLVFTKTPRKFEDRLNVKLLLLCPTEVH